MPNIDTVLRAGEDCFRQVFDHSNDAGFIIDPATGAFADVNIRACELLGYERAELLSLGVAETHPHDVAAFRSFARQVTAIGASWTNELRCRTKNGETIPTEVSASVVQLSTGRYVVAWVRDIRDRRRAEAAERQAREARLAAEVARRRAAEADAHRGIELLRAVVAACPLPIVACDLEGHAAVWNPAAARTFGWDEGEVLGQPLPYYADAKGPDGGSIKRVVMESGGVTTVRTRRVRKDGQPLDVEISAAAVLDAEGQPWGTMGVVEDLSRRRRDEELRRRLTEIIEATPDLIGIATPEGEVLYFNPAGRELLGLEDAQALTIWDARDEEGRQRLRDEIMPFVLEHGLWQGEATLLRTDGTPVSVWQVIQAHRDPSGVVQYLSTVARDTSRQKSLEDQLRQSQKMEAVGRLAGGIAHDFNNLLTAIVGNLYLALHDAEPGTELHASLQDIDVAVQRATDLIQQLLAFSRRQVLQPASVDLNEVVSDLERMLRRLIGEDIALTIDLAPRPVVAQVDRSQLEQVLVNLVVNARDAMPRGGRLRIETAAVSVRNGEAAARALPPGFYARIRVADSGAGMDEATRARVFEPFFTTKEPGKGTGLGLATVHGIVTQSEGHISVQSTPGHGTTFEILLPRAARTSGTTSAEPAAQEIAGTETVLLIEDEPLVRQLVADVLARTGYSVLVAEDGDEALAVADQHAGPIHLLLTDVVLPRLDGPAVASILQARNPGLRVVFMSGYAADRLDHRETGGGVLLEKPFRPTTLLRRIRSVLDQETA